MLCNYQPLATSARPQQTNMTQSRIDLAPEPLRNSTVLCCVPLREQYAMICTVVHQRSSPDAQINPRRSVTGSRIDFISINTNLKQRVCGKIDGRLDILVRSEVQNQSFWTWKHCKGEACTGRYVQNTATGIIKESKFKSSVDIDH